MTALKSIADFFLAESGLFWGYTIILTVFTFVAFALDKNKAKNNAWRTPESTLLLLAFIGGAIGAFLGMILCRHKVRKKKFSIPVPFLALIQTAFIVFVYRETLLPFLF